MSLNRFGGFQIWDIKICFKLDALLLTRNDVIFSLESFPYYDHLNISILVDEQQCNIARTTPEGGGEGGGVKDDNSIMAIA